MEVVTMIAQLLLGLSILVGLHEAGHMVAAKAFGMRVEKFSIGFPPKIFGIKLGETEYSIGALPLGGFVKISGMIDESLDTEQLKKDPEPYEFRSKPAWQRLIVMLGGIIVNVITGIIIFVLLTFFLGKQFIDKDEVNKHGIYVNHVGEEIGLQNGDQLVNLSGNDFQNFRDARSMNFLLEDGSYYTIRRDGKEMKIAIPDDFLDKMSDKDDGPFLSFLNPFKIGKVDKNGPGDKAGLKENDMVMAVNNTPIKYFQEFQSILKENKEKKISIKVSREGQELDLTATPNADGLLKIQSLSLLERKTQMFSFAESIPVGTYDAFDVIFTQLKAFGKIFTGKVNPSKSLSGPIGMASIYGSEWDWGWFWRITGMLSMVLAFMNLLPIPALDGGHVVFLTFEMISGRTPSDNFLKHAQTVGMILLLALMAFAFGNDIYKLIFN